MTFMAIVGLITLFFLMVLISWRQAAKDEFAACQYDESYLRIPEADTERDD